MYYPFHTRWKFSAVLAIRAALVVFFLIGMAAFSQAQEGQNRLLSVSIDEEADEPTMAIRTADPIGYRYTVYDSTDPVRVVIDFPGMDVSGIEAPIPVDSAPLEEIRVSSFDLTSGKLGRVELLLTRASDYDVVVTDEGLQVVFPGFAASMDAVEISEEKDAVEPPLPPVLETEVDQPPSDTAEISSAPEGADQAGAAEEAPTRDARVVESVVLQDSEALLIADGAIGHYRYFPLGAPPRLVIDVLGVRPAFKERSFASDTAFKKVRVGIYEDKTRFVFDAAGDHLPEYTVDKRDNAVAVNWGEGVEGKPQVPPAGVDVPVTVEALDFTVEEDRSVLAIDLSGSPQLIEPTAEGDTVRFGIRNANISRALRRSIDAAAFPSAVRLITPYLVQVGDIQDVRFVAELKGPVDYDLRASGSRVLFSVENGPFAEPAPMAVEQVPVAVPEKKPPVLAEDAQTFAPTSPEEVATATAAAPTPEYTSVEPINVVEADPERQAAYTGEKITLIFDDANIRRIFQLIAEVSDLNMLVGDEVAGNISLRLIDVPWDQALDLILDIKNLGMLREGNVVRILPRDTIREMRQAELTAVKQERDLEPLVTRVMGVSYTDLGNITGPAGELLTDRGKITPDNRNKQLIVTDIPAVLEEVERLVAILDTPEKQVMIEARIVEARTNFTRDLGVSWNFSYTDDATSGLDDLSSGEVSGGGSFIINPNIGAAGLGSSFTFGRLGITSTVLDLRLSAAESAGQSKVISKPRVSTLNGEAAIISQGTQIPYQTVSDEGTQTEFVDATLELNVTPIINPDDSIILEIKATNNTPTTVAGATAPGIDKKEATTKVLVRNGETTVLGGIFTESKSDSETGIPLLRSIPILGHLFKSTNKSSDRSELLIFITPRILD